MRNPLMKPETIFGVCAALLAFGCAASGPTARAPFQLIGGKRIGTLELIEDVESGWMQKTRDSVRFGTRYLHATPPGH
jgi:hypothetical protein